MDAGIHGKYKHSRRNPNTREAMTLKSRAARKPRMPQISGRPWCVQQLLYTADAHHGIMVHKVMTFMSMYVKSQF